MVVSVPHAGVRTAGYEETLTPELDVRGDADLFVDRLYRIGEPDGPETYVAAQLSRFVCDLNRDPDDVGAGRGAGTPGPPQRRRPRLHLGGHHQRRAGAVAAADAPRMERPDRHPHRLPRSHLPRAVRARDSFGFAVLVDGHSMPSRGRAGHTDPGRVRADVVPGDREGQSCSPALLALVTRHFTAAGLTVRPNEPYKGGFITTHHGRPADGLHAIQIELRRDLYMDEEKFTVVQPGFDRLRGLIAGLLTELRDFNP